MVSKDENITTAQSEPNGNTPLDMSPKLSIALFPWPGVKLLALLGRARGSGVALAAPGRV